jgi:alpha,alpha-trehalose phosphorylase
MLVPYDERARNPPPGRGVHPARDLGLRAHTTPEQYPLLLHFPYFDLYRKQVVKQADLVLALHLRGDAFSDEEKARNFAYYER